MSTQEVAEPMLVTGALVFDGHGEQPLPRELRVQDGLFTWVGAPGERATPVPGEDVLDLGGALVVPGLLDVHTHPAFMAALVDSVSCLPPVVQSIDDLVRALAASPRHGLGPDEWIEGFGYDESRYPEARHPDRHDLDRVSTTQPVLVRRSDGHSAVANSRALEIAGVTAATPDPSGAHFGRDEAGEPDGRLTEVAAVDAVAGFIPAPDAVELVERVARLAPHFFERGLVGLGDLLATMVDDPLATFRAAAQRGPFPQVGLYLGWDHIKSDPPTLSAADRSGRVFVAGAKVFLDGAYSNRTAWTHACYPGTSTTGLRTATQADLLEAAAWARGNGVQLAVHAMGDAALDTVIDTFRDEQPWLEHVPSIRLDHATLFSPERIARLSSGSMRFAVVSHTIFFFAEYDAYERTLGPEQFRIAYPIRSFHAGVEATALASDTPATSWADADNVLVSLKAAVVRRSHTGADLGQHESVTVGQGLQLYTSRAARTMALTGLGGIEPGLEASFVVLDRDIFAEDPDTLDQARVLQTWLAGELVHDVAAGRHTDAGEQRSEGT